MIKHLAILLFISSFAAQAVVWNEGTSARLHWGEALVSGNYALNLVDFSLQDSRNSRVMVELLKDNVTLANRALVDGESFSLNDSVKVTAQKIERDDLVDEPYADLRLQLPAAPELSLLLSADKEVYQGGDVIRLELRIENTGIVDADSMKMTLDSKPSMVFAVFSRSGLEAGRSWDENKHTQKIDPVKININAPYLPEPTEFDVRVHAEYEDPEGKKNDAWGGASFQVAGSLQLHKQIEESQDFGKGYPVVDSLWNRGNRTIVVMLSDSTGPDFQTDIALHWQFNLSPGETKTVSYGAVAKMPGEGLIMPRAKGSFVWGQKTYSIFSESPVVDVSGPLIEGRRSASSTLVAPGKEVVISLNLTNSGNKKARVSFLEKIPKGIRLVNGKLSGSFMLLPNEGRTMEYSILCKDPGSVVLPSSNISYYDVLGNTFRASTPEITIEAKAEKKYSMTRMTNVTNMTNITGMTNITNMTNQPATQATEVDEKATWPGENGMVYLSLLIILVFWAVLGRYL